MTCLWQHKNATQHDLGSKKPIFFNCLLDGAHTNYVNSPLDIFLLYTTPEFLFSLLSSLKYIHISEAAMFLCTLYDTV